MRWQVESVSPWRQCAAIVLLIGRLEGMALFGINLPGGLGHVGGAQDEFWSALHPDDRHLMRKFHELADNRNSFALEEFEGRFGRRLQRLAASHDVLVRNSWQGAPLADLMRQQLMHFLDIQSSRAELAGPEIVVSAEAAQAIGLAIHELATNATKYGALSVPAGKIKISWAFDSQSFASRELVKMG